MSKPSIFEKVFDWCFVEKLPRWPIPTYRSTFELLKSSSTLIQQLVNIWRKATTMKALSTKQVQ